MKVTDKHIFFYTEWPSNFRKCKFSWTAFGETHEFFCTEQAFMWAKAMYFNDLKTANMILEENNDPMTCKQLGRIVENYDDDKWSLVRYSFMYDVNYEKYSQNEDLRNKLLSKEYDNKVFVEASPTDRIWGIGLGINNDGIDDEDNWKGRNMLGKAITYVRMALDHDVGSEK